MLFTFLLFCVNIDKLMGDIMSEEATIDYLSSEQDLVIVREQVRKCLETSFVFDFESSKELSNIIFDAKAFLYLNPTEDARLNELIVPGDAFLTVLGSGDFLIDSVYHGADCICTFDINDNQYYVASLKLKALQLLGYEDYYNFFSNPYSEKYLSTDIYERIKRISHNNPQLYAFWDEVILQVMRDRRRMNDELEKLGLSSNKNILVAELFWLGFTSIEQLSEEFLDEILCEIDSTYEGVHSFETIMGVEGIRNFNNYLYGSDNYYRTRDRLSEGNISFVASDIAQLKINLEHSGYLSSSDYNRFASIYLSNIPEYIGGKKFAYIVEEQLMPLLQEGGVIAYCCQGTSPDILTMSREKLNDLKNGAQGIRNDYDALLLYEKINAAEGVSQLSSKYDIDFLVGNTVDSSNGFEDVDTLVYVKKN